MLNMQQKERYFKATKTKQYKNPATKEDIKIEIGEVVPLSFINNKLNITTSSATVLRIQNDIEEVHNYNKNEVSPIEVPVVKGVEDADKKNTKNKPIVPT